jgi:hypothetical protein
VNRLFALFRLGLIWLSLSTVFGPLSPDARGANLIVLDANPFASDAVQVLDFQTASDWTSSPDPLPGLLAVTGETFDPVAGLILPTHLVLGTAPTSARYLLVNQIEADIAFFDYTEALPGGMVDSDRNGLPDFWEQHHFARLGVDPESDVDGDGFTQQAESDAGTDPLNPDSKPVIPGLIGVWRGEDDTRDTAGSLDGTWNGPPHYAQGRLGRAFDLRGDNSVRVADDAVLRPANGFTIAAWVKLSQLSGNPKPILTCPSSSPGIPALGLAVDAQGPRLRMATVYASRFDGPIISLSTNVWYHLAASWDTSVLKLYWNGRLAYSLRLPAGFGPLDFAPGRDLLLGHDGHTGYLPGLLDEVVLAGRTLTAAEVLSLSGGNSSPRGAVPDGALVVERQDQTVWWFPAGASVGRFVTHGYNARLSADRRWLLFRRAPTEPAATGYEGLWRRNLVSGQESFLFTLDKSHQYLGFDWSGDATSAVFADAQTGRIERRALSGEAPQLLLSSWPAAPMDLAVSRADGRLTWFTSTGRTADDRPWVAGPDGSSASAIPGTQAADYFSRYRFPAWSLDGQWIALKLGRNLLKLRPDGAGALALTQFTGTGGELVLHDAAPAWTPDGKHLVAIASPSGYGSDASLLWIPTDGSGNNAVRTLDGSSPAGIVFGGNLAAPGWRLVLDLLPATQPGGTPRLRFEVPEGTGLLLESADALGSTWGTETPIERLEGGRRFWELPVSANSPVQFYRLRIAH